MSKTISRSLISVLAIVAILALPALAAGHESRDVADGQYRLVVGFLNEPVAVGDKSGLDLRVSKPAPAGTPDTDGDGFVPVEGLETTIQAEVFYTDQNMALTVSPRFGQPGAYASYFYPNAVGDYSFRIFGTIEGVAIDETFTSGPDTFGPVEERLLFPAETTAAGGEQPMVTSAGLDLTAGLPGGSFGVIAVVAAAVAAAVGLHRRIGPAPKAAVNPDGRR
jgi:hypothetical protein